MHGCLGAARAFPYPDVCDVVYRQVPGLDLGDEFRSPLSSDVPTLFISGTLDGVTPVSNAPEVARGFTSGRHLIIHGAAHDDDLFLSSPLIADRIRAFLNGDAVEESSLAVPFDFALPER
jgi:pimeloyl-ACP methyl ester carboxylesterase